MPSSLTAASSLAALPFAPDVRCVSHNTLNIQPNRRFVLYWMVAQRRTSESFALQHAVAHANALGLPLVIFEPLRIGYEHASDRLHRFVLDGMRDHRDALKRHDNVVYYPYVEPVAGAAKGLLEALSQDAALIVTDDYPAFFIPRMIKAAAARVKAPLIGVDSNGLLPLRATDRIYTTAYSFRRGLHKLLPDHLGEVPAQEPLDQLTVPAAPADLLASYQARWPQAGDALLLDRTAGALRDLLIDHTVAIAPLEGGDVAALKRAQDFVTRKLSTYHTRRNDPDAHAASGLSPYLHFGHISAHAVWRMVCEREGWSVAKLSSKPTGQREGWWNMSEEAEAFLDELITWREIGFNMAHHEPTTYNTYLSVPDFARQTLDDHRHDTRDPLYTLEELETAETHDPIWNAAQRQLIKDGIIHNYLRMLWGKKILEWSETPEAAAERMIYLNDKYALDGRDPNSYRGIFWCLGRYDRGWAERDIFGKVRYMSSDNTAKKIAMSTYLKRYQKPKKT